MKGNALSQVWGHFGSLTPTQRLTLVAVAEVVNDVHDYDFWMTPDKLAAKVGIDRRHVARHMNALVTAGWLEVTETGPKRSITRYRWVDQNAPIERDGSEPTAPDERDTAPIERDTAPIERDTALDEREPGGPSSYREKEEPEGTSRADRDPAYFATFWELYPRKIAKGAARVAFVSAVRKAGPTTVLDGVRTFRDQCRERKVEAKFMPYPATWLNSERWADEPDASPPPPPAPGGRRPTNNTAESLQNLQILGAS